MKKYFIIAFAIILTGISLSSCNDENWTPNSKKQKKPFDVEDARKFLKQNSTNDFILPDFDNNTLETRSGKSYDWKSSRPQWKRSRIIEGEDFYALQTALEDGIRHTAKLTITENGKTREEVNRWFSRLVVYKQKKTGHTTAMIFSVIPDIEWFKRNKSSVSHLNFNDLKDFSGVVIYSKPDGTTMNATQYVDGQRTRVRLLNPPHTHHKFAALAQDSAPKVQPSMKKTIHLCLHGVQPTLLTQYSGLECHSDDFTGVCSGCGSYVLGDTEVLACDVCREEEDKCKCCGFCGKHPCECCSYCGASSGHDSSCPLVDPGTGGDGGGGLNPGTGGGGGTSDSYYTNLGRQGINKMISDLENNKVQINQLKTTSDGKACLDAVGLGVNTLGIITSCMNFMDQVKNVDAVAKKFGTNMSVAGLAIGTIQTYIAFTDGNISTADILNATSLVLNGISLGAATLGCFPVAGIAGVASGIVGVIATALPNNAPMLVEVKLKSGASVFVYIA